MSLIIEGSDNLGKTTFAKKLVRYVWDHDKYPCMYSWMTRPNEKTFDFFDSYEMMINPYTIQDRFHFGALAYHKDKISYENLTEIERWIQDAGGFVVLFYAKDKNWYRRYIARDERGNILADDILCKGNSVFTSIASGHHSLRPDFKYAFDISDKQFVSDENVERIAEIWIRYRQRKMEQLLGK